MINHLLAGLILAELLVCGRQRPQPLDTIRRFHDPDGKVLVGTGINPTARSVGSAARDQVQNAQRAGRFSVEP